MTSDDVDWLLMHQANVRILESAAKKMGISMDKVIKNFAGGLTLGSGSGRVVFRTIAHTRAVGAGPWAFVSLALPLESMRICVSE